MKNRFLLVYFSVPLNYRKNLNRIRTIFTKNRGLVAEVRIIHVNWKNAHFLVAFSHKTVITLHYTWQPTCHPLGKRCRMAMTVSRTVIWVDVLPSLVVLKPRSHSVRRRKLTHSERMLVDVRRRRRHRRRLTGCRGCRCTHRRKVAPIGKMQHLKFFLYDFFWFDRNCTVVTDRIFSESILNAQCTALLGSCFPS